MRKSGDGRGRQWEGRVWDWVWEGSEWLIVARNFKGRWEALVEGTSEHDRVSCFSDKRLESGFSVEGGRAVEVSVFKGTT
jgi:hypothetical protein